MGKNILFGLAVVFLISSCNAQNTMIDKTVVKNFELEKYLGTWYEIARYDNSFERGLTGVTATYSLRGDGKIEVVNAGYKESLNGPKSNITGKAKVPDPAVPSKLKVSFFWFFYSDYYVLELDPDYQWAAVGSSSDKYLWILSRTPQMDEKVYASLLKKLVARGYDTSALIRVEQKPD